MSLRDEALVIAGRVTSVGEARDMLLRAQQTLADGEGEAGKELSWWQGLSGEGSALLSLVNNTRDYAMGVYDSLGALDDTAPLDEQDRQRVGLAVAQIADTVQALSDAMHDPGFAAGFISDLGSSWSAAVHGLADTMKGLIAPFVGAFWPLWLLAGVLGAAWVWLNWRAIRRKTALR